MQHLKANTQVKVVIGPFVDVGDGFTPETGITLGSADEAELIKHDAGSVTSISGNTWAAITSCDGYYNLTLTTSDTNTEGMITVVVQDDSVCLPVIARFMVLSEAAYDSLYLAKDTGFMDINVKAISEDTTAADNLESACDNYSATRGLAGTALPNAAADAAGGLPISDAGGLDLDGRLDADISSRSSHDAADVWTSGTRTLTALGFTLAAGDFGASSLDGKGDWGDATAANQVTIAGYLDTEIAAIITHLTDIKGAGWTSTDTLEEIANDVTGLNGATPPTAAAIRSEIDANSTQLTAILEDTGTTIPAQVSGLLTTAMTESYGTDGSALTLAQCCYLILGNVSEFSISGTTKTVKQLDGAATAATYTLDDADNPTSVTRST